LNGNKISQISGNKKIKISAKGQHITNKINHNTIAINVFIETVFVGVCKRRTKRKSCEILLSMRAFCTQYSFVYTGLFKNVHECWKIRSAHGFKSHIKGHNVH
jgi:hypothetical protein